jgi:hypothetical protein
VPIRAGAALITPAAARHHWTKRVRRAVLGLRSAGLVVLAVVAEAPVAAPARAGDEAEKAPSPVAPIAVEGTVLKITLTDGRVLNSRDLIGAQSDRSRRPAAAVAARQHRARPRRQAPRYRLGRCDLAAQFRNRRAGRLVGTAMRERPDGSRASTTLLDLSKKDVNGSRPGHHGK